MLKNKICSLTLLISYSAFGQSANKTSEFLSLDTTCVVSNETINREGLFFELSVDTIFNKCVGSEFDLEIVDSSIFNKFNKKTDKYYSQKACTSLKIESDSLLVIENDQFKWRFSSSSANDIQDAKLIGYDIRKYYKIDGVLAYYNGFIPELNLAIVNLVDVDGAYATTHLIDLVSGKLIDDLSENDNGVEAYTANKNYIAYYANNFYENCQSDLGLISINRTSNKKYCLTMKGGIQMNDYLIYNVTWMDTNSLIAHLRKLIPAEEDVYIKIRIK